MAEKLSPEESKDTSHQVSLSDWKSTLKKKLLSFKGHTYTNS